MTNICCWLDGLFLESQDIKRMHVNRLVDTVSVCMYINETMQEVLQLHVVDKVKGQLAGGSSVEYDVGAPIAVRFRNRR